MMEALTSTPRLHSITIGDDVSSMKATRVTKVNNMDKAADDAYNTFWPELHTENSIRTDPKVKG